MRREMGRRRSRRPGASKSGQARSLLRDQPWSVSPLLILLEVANDLYELDHARIGKWLADVHEFISILEGRVDERHTRAPSLKPCGNPVYTGLQQSGLAICTRARRAKEHKAWTLPIAIASQRTRRTLSREL
jgi:hypothetical protein